MNKRHVFDIDDRVVFHDKPHSVVFRVTHIKVNTTLRGVEEVVYSIENLDGTIGYSGIDEYRLDAAPTSGSNNQDYDRAMRGI